MVYVFLENKRIQNHSLTWNSIKKCHGAVHTAKYNIGVGGIRLIDGHSWPCHRLQVKFCGVAGLCGCRCGELILDLSCLGRTIYTWQFGVPRINTNDSNRSIVTMQNCKDYISIQFNLFGMTENRSNQKQSNRFCVTQNVSNKTMAANSMSYTGGQYNSKTNAVHRTSWQRLKRRRLIWEHETYM